MSPPLVRLDVWGTRRLAPALLRMATGRRALRGTPGLRDVRLLGTGSGRSFSVRDADPGHWALLTTWDDEAAADRFAGHRVTRAWQDDSSERLCVRMVPVTARGRWSGRTPFEPVATGSGGGGPVAAITRARLRPSRIVQFWRAVPPVAEAVGAAAGVRLALGIGEAPIGVQGTFSLWESRDHLVDFAYRGAAHRAVVERTPQAGWYTEELFARFAVLGVEGTYRGRQP